MDYRPYDQGGPVAEQSQAVLPQGQQHGQSIDFGPPPPPYALWFSLNKKAVLLKRSRPRRYNVWGMDYRPYDQGGPFEEQSGTPVPQVRHHDQNTDSGPPPPP